MDTIKKGDWLENQAFNVFENQIKDGTFLTQSQYTKIYKKKGYYSKDRQKDIIFDISIEVTYPNQTEYSLLFLIECKNYLNHKVPVDDTEEFFSKIQQISGANVKGIIVSTNAFQESAFKYADSKGIGLLRFYNREKLDWVLTRSPSNASANTSENHRKVAVDALHNINYKSRYFDLFGYTNMLYTISSNEFFSNLIKPSLNDKDREVLKSIETKNKKLFSSVPYLDEEYIELEASKILGANEYIRGSVSIDSLSNYLNKSFDLQVNRFVSLDKGVLGQISFNPDIISIDDTQASSDERVRFTLAHEFGHYLLQHNKYMTKEQFHEEDFELENIENLNLKDIQRMEWQANYFASCLLLPKTQFLESFAGLVEYFGLSNRGYGLIYLDNQKCNLDTFYQITSPLMKNFQVSRSVVKLRLISLGFLNEVKQKSHEIGVDPYNTNY